MNHQADARQRLGIYRRLALRNRLVSILRLGVPALGTIVLLALLLQIYLSSLGGRFGIGQIAVTRDSITVEAPEYAGLLDDGSAYRVWAVDARAAIDATDLIDLTDAALTIDRPSGVTMLANAGTALLDTTRRLVAIDGPATVEDTTGTRGTFRQSIFDWAAQVLDAGGPVHIDYADGASVDAASMTYDAKAQVWTFRKATVTLPDTPGAQSKDTQP